MTMETKLCRICHQNRPTSDFYAHNATKDGLGIYCKDCLKLYNKRRYGTDDPLEHMFRKISLIAHERVVSITTESGACIQRGLPSPFRDPLLPSESREGDLP